MTTPVKHTKWLNRVAANVVIDGNIAKLYIGIILIDEGIVTVVDSTNRSVIMRKNGTFANNAWEWIEQIEKNLQIVY